MKRSHTFLLLLLIFLLTLALHTVSNLLRLLVEDAATDLIHPHELTASSSSTTTPQPQLIPKILHQTYRNTSLPPHWAAARSSCLTLHPDYTYHLWTDTANLAFITTHYPSFLPTYTSYPHAIQRADAIRYFILRHHGGVYLDLDNGCAARMDPLLAFPAWLHETTPTGISNDAMAAVPGHPFFVFVTEQLERYHKNWGVPYLTVMASTGPLFLSVLWERYMAGQRAVGAVGGSERERGGGNGTNPVVGAKDEGGNGRVRILTAEQYNKGQHAFFTSAAGSSWHGADARFFQSVARHWVVISVVAAGIIGLAVLTSCWIAGRMRRRGGRVVLEPGSPRRGADEKTPKQQQQQQKRGLLLRFWGAQSWHRRKRERKSSVGSCGHAS